MKNAFLSLLIKENNFTTTENGAIALKSTTSALVDLFGCIGSLRMRGIDEIERLFSSAYAEDALLATKMAFYARNVRGGLGERRTFRTIIKYLSQIAPSVIIKNFDNIALFGRYDDFYELIGTSIEAEMWAFLKNQLDEDLKNLYNNLPVSLLAKWLKSVNTSSRETNWLGKSTAKAFGLSEKAYRKTLSMLRKYIDVTEVKMSSNEWTQIEYSHVPSRAMCIYRNAFNTHDKEGFTTYIEALEKGEATIHSSTLYPYDIIERLGINYHTKYFSFANHDKILEQQWKNLPNYIEGEHNVLVMADTSGSMYGRPLCTSLGLAIYFAERNKGAFKDTFMTFSSKPSLVTLKGSTLYDKIKCIPAIVADTNLEAAFMLILNTAKKHKLSACDLPKSLVVITDMEFNFATTSRGDWTFYESMRKSFAKEGYQIPNVVFWNVNSRHDCFQVTSNYQGVQMASGQSPSVFKTVLANVGKTPYEAMLNTLSDPIYDSIAI